MINQHQSDINFKKYIDKKLLTLWKMDMTSGNKQI